MLSKNEFRSDKPYSGFWSKLYLTKKQRRCCLKWTLYGLLLLLLSLFQDVIACHFRILGATTELVPVGIFLICILEGSDSGSVFALIAAGVYLFSGTAAGEYCLVLLTVLPIGVSMLRQAYLQQGMSAAMLCTALGMLCYMLLQYFCGLFFGLTIASRIVGFLITAGLSMLAAPIIYPIALAIERIGGEVWKE